MGSLSLPSWPSGHIHQYTHICPFPHTMKTVFLLCVLSAPSLASDRSVVSYLGDTFLLPDGCPVDNPMVQRFYKLCLESHQDAPLCTKERLSRTQTLTIPYVTSVCTAICLGLDESAMTVCPHKSLTIHPYSPLHGLRYPIQQTADTTFQYGQVSDRTYG